MATNNPDPSTTRSNTEAAEIPQAEWERFLDDFSRMHEGWVVSVEVTLPDGSSRKEVNSRPLGGVSASLKGPDPRIMVAFDDDLDNHVAHLVSDPKRVAVTGRSGDEIVIESADGTRTLVRCAKSASRSGQTADAA